MELGLSWNLDKNFDGTNAKKSTAAKATCQQPRVTKPSFWEKLLPILSKSASCVSIETKPFNLLILKQPDRNLKKQYKNYVAKDLEPKSFLNNDVCMSLDWRYMILVDRIMTISKWLRGKPFSRGTNVWNNVLGSRHIIRTAVAEVTQREYMIYNQHIIIPGPSRERIRYIGDVTKR